MKYHHFFILILLLSFTASCTDLDVTPYSELTKDNYYQTKIQIMSAVNRTYTQSWTSLGMDGYSRISELSADQLVWSNKGRHGYDDGQHGRQHYHSWTITDQACWQPWNRIYTGIGYINSVLDDLETVNFEAAGMTATDKKEVIAEMRGMRAFYYMKLMDLFGNIPVVTKVGKPLNPPTEAEADVFKFIETELLAAAADCAPLSEEVRGRFNKASAYAALVELYLNAEVWSGHERWEDCITYCNKIMGGEAGNVSLDLDIDKAFSNTNASMSTELLFTNASDKSQGRWINPINVAYFAERDILGTDYAGNNGMVCTTNAYEAYGKYDLRKYSWFLYGIGTGYGGYNYQGPYKNISPDPTRASVSDYVIGSEEFAGLPIIFSNKPIKAVIKVENENIKITEWYSPEFPSDEAKNLVEEALNGKKTKEQIIKDYREKGTTEIYLAGGYNTTDARQYSWSEMNDYRYIWYDCKENSGARFHKYNVGKPSDDNYGNNYYVYYRLTDIYFAKAEAIMRKNGSATDEVVELINAAKKRAFLPEYWSSDEAVSNKDRYTAATLTFDELLAERGREFIFECKRRTDLIRFDKFEFGVEGWWDGNAGYPDGSSGSINKDKTRRLLPIPYRAMQANPNLKQNPGYDD